jgi:hypothetical protein
MDRLCRLLASVGFVALVAISFLTMFDAIMRWMIWPSIPGFGDWGRLAFPIIICAVFPAVLLYRRNVNIGFLGAALGPWRGSSPTLVSTSRSTTGSRRPRRSLSHSGGGSQPVS